VGGKKNSEGRVIAIKSTWRKAGVKGEAFTGERYLQNYKASTEWAAKNRKVAGEGGRENELLI